MRMILRSYLRRKRYRLVPGEGVKASGYFGAAPRIKILATRDALTAYLIPTTIESGPARCST